jgi:hypothetical protein
MASDKKRRKAVRQAQKQRQGRTGAFRHPDGDRRRRGGERVEDAVARKQAMQRGFIIPASEEDPAKG